jgi:hypothetical protein
MLTPDHKSLRKKINFDSDLHIDLLEMQGDNSVLSPHVSVSSEFLTYFKAAILLI